MTVRLLLVDDEPMVRSSLRRLLDEPDRAIDEAGSVAEAADRLRERRYDLAVVDYKLGDGTGLDVLDRVRTRHPETMAIMLTAYGRVNVAVEAVKKGAYDFLEKDGEPQLTRHVVEKALEQVRLRREVETLQRERLRGTGLPRIVAESDAMRHVLDRAEQFARTDATVLIQGETGTGKSLLAEAIHCSSPRADRAFVTINCGAIPKELIESELFGYADGAFTGARQKGKMGLIERADGGTLLLDEIGDLSLDLQSRLLHVLETREFLRVGAVEPTRVDVRFIAATNVDLAARIAEDRFRRDLYYRLDVAALRVPPLRQRTEDILPLAWHFARRLGERYERRVREIDPSARAWLEGRDWPGNVREVRNVVERALLLLPGDTVTADDLAAADADPDTPATPAAPADGLALTVELGRGTDVLTAVTEQVVRQAWERSGHNQTQAARLLGIPRTTFQTYVQKFDLRSGPAA